MSQQYKLPLQTDPFIDETELVSSLVEKAGLSLKDNKLVTSRARALVTAIRAGRKQAGGIEEFMQEYQLSSHEGIVLMCLAEALLRIPDAETADQLIADKIGSAAWENHLGSSDSLFVNASTWGLMLTGNIIEAGATEKTSVGGFLSRLVARVGEPVIRQAMRHAMRIMGAQFVLGRTITEAMKTAKPLLAQGYRFSFDMLGEAAYTMADAERYYNSYFNALGQVAKASSATKTADVMQRPSISIKLSALHPRYEEMQRGRVLKEMLPKLVKLAIQAKNDHLGLTIDAEEMDRLDLSLEIFAGLAHAPELTNWNGLGLAVQAYSKGALAVLEWLENLAKTTRRQLPVRLVKGAYWDTEIKRAQEAGLPAYPVFTRKIATDVSYLACARYLLARRPLFYPQFASHNAQTIAAVSVMSGEQGGFECQRLHGMGQALYDEIIDRDGLNLPARIYAPVGSHEDLLAYLVRRLLENGANSSFVNRLSDDEMPIETIIANPVSKLKALKTKPHPGILPPRAIFTPRKSANGYPLWHRPTRDDLLRKVSAARQSKPHACPIINGNEQGTGTANPITSPQDHDNHVGTVTPTTTAQIPEAIAAAHQAQRDWNDVGGKARATILRAAADLFEQATGRFLSLLILEAGKTLENAVADLREAVDFLRYYGDQAAQHFTPPTLLPGPTGEENYLDLRGRGVFCAISPWNFPLAIFTGQVSAALAAGNTVIAKPAEQTPLIAYEAVKLLHQAGVPGPALQFLPGKGSVIGAQLVGGQQGGDADIAGVVFTGSTETAATINQSLAARGGPIVPFIAETGGMNAMLADSTALPEQIIRDVVRSAFDSAGQRCSAARILFIQSDIAKKTITMLKGAVEELKIGDPLCFDTDIGPVIDENAKTTLQAHKNNMARIAKTIIDPPLPAATGKGTFVSPAVYQLDDITPLTREVFGPVLHVVEYQADKLEAVCEAINNTGYGLTFGINTRIEATAKQIAARINAGNIYVNRNQIGAVVGAQPFGGSGLSGTGPKAGGPHYLTRFASEKVISTDITASGGNAALLSLASE
jgi:RHH-type proline utilization regulon transcriptional repressor/proline dehydrogenase/delta 1-pyrroline-5-carboxylate dehydrogenase